MPKKPTILRSTATLPFGLLIAACSGNVVDLGGGSAEVEGAVPAACAGPGGDGNFVVLDQAGLEALSGCEEVGALSIYGPSELELRPLSSLRVVREMLSIASFGYELRIEPTTWLDSLEGLESLEQVGALSLSGVSAPTLEPLRNLAEVSGYVAKDGVGYPGSLSIERASHLQNLIGLDNAVGFQRLLLHDNPELESLDGLQLPSTPDRIGLVDNPKLTNIEAMSHVIGIEQLQIHATGIERLDAKLQTLGQLSVEDNPALVDITGFDELMAPSRLHIQNNAQLRRLPEFPKLILLDSLIIAGNPALRWLPTFPALEGGSPWSDEVVTDDTPMRTLKIADNTSLEQFVAPPRLRAVASLFIQNNASLREIDLGGLEALTQLTISNNPSLVSVSLDRLQTVNSLELLDNGQLLTAGFSDVQTFTRNMQGNAGDAAP